MVGCDIDPDMARNCGNCGYEGDFERKEKTMKGPGGEPHTVAELEVCPECGWP